MAFSASKRGPGATGQEASVEIGRSPRLLELGGTGAGPSVAPRLPLSPGPQHWGWLLKGSQPDRQGALASI